MSTRTLHASALILAGLLSTAAHAVPVNLETVAIGGGYNNPQLGGGPGIIDNNVNTAGFIGNTFPPGGGTDDGGQFGATLAGSARITSFAITQASNFGAGRSRLRDITVHAGEGRTYQFTLADNQARQEFALPEPVTGTYLLVTADTYYAGADPNPGIAEFEILGQQLRTDVNHNAGIVPVVVGPLGGFSFPARATDGVIHHNSNDASNTTFFARNAGSDSLTVTFPGVRTVASIGLGIAADSTPPGLRDYPRFVTLESDAGSHIINLEADLLQYGRYDLVTPISTTFVRLVFPDGSVLANWFIHNDANYGITEFQAFEFTQIFTPEPATAALGLLAFAALGLRRRRA